MKLKKTALIGIGYWGKVHLKYLKKIKNIKIKKFGKSNLTNNLKKIINDKSIRYIDIVTPIETHAKLAIKLAKKNKKVLVEKPLLMDSYELKQYENILKKNNNQITVSYPYTFSKTLNHANKIINSKLLGSIKYIDIDISQCGRFMKFGVNHLLGPHAISIISIFYNIRKVSFKKFNIIETRNKIETSILLVKIKNKIIGKINLSLNFASVKKKKLVTIYCDKGTIICDLENKIKTLVCYKYQRLKHKNYSLALLKKKQEKFFNENDNINNVIKNFIDNKKSLDNSILTKKINNFLK